MNRMTHSPRVLNVNLAHKKTLPSQTQLVLSSQESMDIDGLSNLPCIDDDEHTQMISVFYSLRVQAYDKDFQIHDVSANGDFL